jgi:hypothetical protein
MARKTKAPPRTAVVLSLAKRVRAARVELKAGETAQMATAA